MIIKIQQPNTITENISKSILDYLYLKFQSNNSSNNANSLLEGRVEVDYEYEKYINYLETLYNRFKVNINREMLIWFDDKNVENILVTNLNISPTVNGIPVSYKIDLSNISTWFSENTNIQTFNELGLFKNVIQLNNNAFKDCTSLTEIDLSNIQVLKDGSVRNTLIKNVNCPNLTLIEGNVFRYCLELETIENLGNITEIKDYDFCQCYNLSSVNLPENLTTIRRYSFYQTGLISIEFPNTLTTIGENAFEKCTSLTSIDLSNTSITNNNVRNAIFFGCTALTSVMLPSNITSIKNDMFRGCTNLSLININNVTEINNNAFKDCTSLNIELNLPNLTYIGGYAFNNTSITRITNLGQITSINSYYQGGIWCGAFHYCTNLVSCALPNTLTTIGGNTFCGCTALTTITGGSNITYLESGVFEKCNKLETLGNIDLTKLTNIGDACFNECSKLSISNLNCPNLTYLGARAFDSCSLLLKVSDLGSITTLSHRYHGGINRGVFMNCTNLTSVTLPNTLTKMEDRTFAGCTQLSSINIPTSVTEIGESIFNGCKLLNNAVLYFKNVSYVGKNTFRNTYINEVYMPHLTSLYGGWWENFVRTDGAFSGNYTSGQNFNVNLLYLKSDETISFGPGTFVHFTCSNLIINIDTPPSLDTNGMNQYSNITNIYVPDNFVNLYKAAENWSKYSSIIKGISTFPYVVNTYEEYEILRDNGDTNIYLIREYMT